MLSSVEARFVVALLGVAFVFCAENDVDAPINARSRA